MRLFMFCDNLRGLALAAVCSLAPLASAAVAAPAQQQQAESGAAQTPADDASPASAPAAPAAAPAPAQAEEDKRICRYIKPETASRRKVKVCRTVEEWREFTNIR
jgi:hypothetical protein